jgi:hypothetical protein
MWDLWWTKWHWDRFFYEFFGFPLSISFHWCSITRKRAKNKIHKSIYVGVKGVWVGQFVN